MTKSLTFDKQVKDLKALEDKIINALVLFEIPIEELSLEVQDEADMHSPQLCIGPFIVSKDEKGNGFDVIFVDSNEQEIITMLPSLTYTLRFLIAKFIA